MGPWSLSYAMAIIQYVRAKELLEAELGEELVALDTDGGHCFGFNSVAADIWRLLDRPQNLETLQQGLVERYDVDAAQCADDLKSCLADLEAKGLIRSIDSDR